jgi:hypothetical protein
MRVHSLASVQVLHAARIVATCENARLCGCMLRDRDRPAGIHAGLDRRHLK